jgi:6-phosphogluconolactonase
MKRVLADERELARAAAEFVVAAGRAALAERGRFEMLLSGGGTPRLTYEALAAGGRAERDLWAATHFYWSDERCVPPSHAASNYLLAQTALLAPLGVAAGQVHRIRGEQASPEEAAAEYEGICPTEPDLVLMGLGVDGHTASIFPQSPALREERRRFLAVRAPVGPAWRVTITPIGLARARRALVIACGAGKRAALAAVFAPDGSTAETPARLVRDSDWLVDRAAEGPGRE